MAIPFKLYQDSEVKKWLRENTFPMLECDVRMAASALLMLNRQAGKGYDSYIIRDIKAAAIFITNRGYMILNDSVWKGCKNINNKGRVTRGLYLLGYFCLRGTALKLKDLSDREFYLGYSPFFTLTPCFRILKEAEHELSKILAYSTFEQVRSAIHHLLVIADNESQTELTHELCLKALKMQGNTDRLKEIISFIDRRFSMHWEKPQAFEPYTPLPLPTDKEADIYFDSLYEKRFIRIDMIIVKAVTALKAFGQSSSSVGQYMKIFKRFRWYCFKEGQSFYRPELYKRYLKFEQVLTYEGKQRQWKSSLAVRGGTVLSAVANSGTVPNDIFKKAPFKHQDPDIEAIRSELYVYIRKERKLSEAFAGLNNFVFKMILNGSSTKTAAQLKELGNAELDLILHHFRARCSKKSSLASLLPILRNVLTWLYEHGYIRCNLAYGVINPHFIKTYNPPYLKVSDQKRLEDYSSKESWRNRCFILLGLNLGLRQSDILALRKCDIDFKRKKLSIIQQKTGVPLELPLDNMIVQAVRNYINLERPKPYTEDTEPIFLSMFPPFLPLNSLYSCISKVLKKNGISPENGSARGPHLLRYSLVHSLMKAKTKHKIITDTLGHTSENSDRPYLSMNKEMLLKCALDLSLIGKDRNFALEDE